VATIESIGSSTRIEGSKLSDREVERLLLNIAVQPLESRDEQGKQIGIVFETATPFDTPRLMAELIDWVRLQRDQQYLHPLLIVSVFVVVFLEIHPFQDGNSRLSRALTTLLLLQAGYAHTPYSSLENVIEQSKEAYYLALRQTQTSTRTDTPDWQPWMLFFLRSLSEQVRRLEKKWGAKSSCLPRCPGCRCRSSSSHGNTGVSPWHRRSG